MLPLGALALGQDRSFGSHGRSCFFQDHAHALERRAGADDVIQDDNLLSLQQAAVFLVQDEDLGLAGSNR